MSTCESSWRERFVQAAQQPVDAASLAVFRVGLGVILLWEVVRYFYYGWIRDFYIATRFNFTYPGLGWLKPLPAIGMYSLFIAMGIAALGVILGRFYKCSMAILAMGMTYVLLLDQTAFLNHLYLVSLICWLMLAVPTQRVLSWQWPKQSAATTETVPSWCLWLIRLQLAIPYVYGGLVKINSDWLQGQPLQLWMLQMEGIRDWLPIYGERWLAISMSWAGLFIDLFVVPALLWKPTQKVALVIAVTFHLWNSTMFHIGIFPWFMIVATTLFLPPNWPRRFIKASIPTQNIVADSSCRSTRRILILMAFWFSIQLIVPWRHMLYEGNVDWTEEGTRFAWRMMLHDKWSAIRMTLVDPKTRKEHPFNPLEFLSKRQFDKMSYEPELLRQFAHHIADISVGTKQGRQEVHFFVLTSLNGRKPQLLIDPTVDLGAEPFRWGRQPWIMPLETPLPPKPWTPPVDRLGRLNRRHSE